MNAAAQKSALFCRLVPALALLVSASIVLFPMLRAYENLRHAPRTTLKNAGRDEVYILMGQFQLPADGLCSFVTDMTATEQEPIITLLNAPGYLIYALVGSAIGHEPRWSPASVFPPLWRVLIIPFCAIPAWWFVGRGIDAFFRGIRLRLADAMASLVLLLGSATLSGALRFGLTPQERADEVSTSFQFGFAWWAALFAIPLAAWIYQRSRRSRA